MLGGNYNLYHALQVTSEMFTEENEFIIQDEGLSQEEKRKYIFLCAEGNKPLEIEEYDSISQIFSRININLLICNISSS